MKPNTPYPPRTGGSQLANQKEKKNSTLQPQPKFQRIVHGSKDCTIAVAKGILLSGFSIGHTTHFLQALPEGLSLRSGFLLPELVVVELLHAFSEECRIVIREYLAYIQCQAPNSLVPVTPSISLERRKDNG
jgi:hypothetical protein